MLTLAMQQTGADFVLKCGRLTRGEPSRHGGQQRGLTKSAHRVVDVAGRASAVHVDRPDNKLVLGLG